MTEIQEIIAYIAYRDREAIGFCSGNELQSFFRNTLGEPSPHGSVPMDGEKWESFVASCMYAMKNNSPKAAEGVRRLAEELPVHTYTLAGVRRGFSN